MSVQAISWVFEFSESRLGPRHVLLSIANHAKADGTGAWPSVRRICHEAKLSEREVRYALRELEKSGELQTRVGVGPRGCNVYSLPRMGQSLQGQKTAGGGQNPAQRHAEFAPEPKSINRKEPSYAPQKRRRLSPMQEIRLHRQRQDEEIRKELAVGLGPRL